MPTFNVDRGIQIPKTKLHPNPWNDNEMTRRQQSAVGESIDYYGQVIELLVQPHPDIDGEYQVIDGEHRLATLPETASCNIIYGLSESDAKKLTMVLGEGGQPNPEKRATLLFELEQTLSLEELQLGLGYEPDELSSQISKGRELNLSAQMEADPFSELEPEEPPERPEGKKVPLAIVLEWEEFQVWEVVKESLGLKSDKAAFLKLIQGA